MTAPTPSFVTALLFLLSSISKTANAAEFIVDWKIPVGEGSELGFYDDMKAEVGDTAVFDWKFAHNVFRHPSGNCNESGAIPVGDVTGSSHTFTADDVGEVAFACDVGSHCELGQIVKFTVSAKAVATSAPTTAPVTKEVDAADLVVDWIIPLDGVGPLPARTAKVGETIRFDWDQTEGGEVHNVYVHPNGGCDKTGAIFLGDFSGPTHTFTADDVGEVVFACDVANHCLLGQLMTVTVSGDDTSGSDGSGGSLWTLPLLLVVATIFL